VSNSPLAFWTARVEAQMDLRPCDGCDACGLRCAAGVPLSHQEYQTVRHYLQEPGRLREVRAVEEQDKQIHLGEGVVVRACRFRDRKRGRCAIYPVRPLVCRLLGHVEWMPCPIGRIRRTASTADALEMMRAYAQQPRRTYEEWLAEDPAPHPGAREQAA